MAAGLAVLVFAPGLAIGSFLNVVSSRVPAHRSIVAPRSACPSCSKPIEWYDNIPVVSYLLLRGSCRNCGARIGWKYPAVELGTALLISACLLRFGPTPYAAVAAFFCAVLVAVTVTDLEYRIIPNLIVLPAAAAVLVAQTAIDPSLEWAIAALGGALFFFLAALAYPGGMGMGDVKLALLLGAMLGRTLPIGLMIGMVAALLPAVVLFARHGQKARTMTLPLAPFLAFGALVALFAGQSILKAYLSLG
jgi:leader peptidase (prepilin peptidase) / N-methyltransferase